MTRVAILGGGIAGLAAAFELEQQRRAGSPVDWYLYEAADRLGGIVETTRLAAPGGEYILEGGPDAWVTEKPWARELAEELGLGGEIIPCNEATRKTYVWVGGQLVPMPDRMRMMVPEDLAALGDSALFSPEARAAYAHERERADELKATAPTADESVASFVRRHFGDEVLEKIGAPLLSGVFGGDPARLSVRAVMSPFVRMEAEHGSLIVALQRQRAARGDSPRPATFTSLRRGMGSLVEALVAALPADRLHTGNTATELARSSDGQWLVRFTGPGSNACAVGFVPFEQVVLATPVDGTRKLLAPISDRAATLIPQNASSAVLASFCWPSETAQSFTVPPGFGFLVPQTTAVAAVVKDVEQRPRLLAGTFTDQKFPHRAPPGARVIRTFFGGETADALEGEADQAIAAEALRELQAILPGLPAPEPALTTVRRWPRSLPQYEVGHLDRMAELDGIVARLGQLHLLGNGYRGVGVPDLIRDARAVAREIAASARPPVEA